MALFDKARRQEVKLAMSVVSWGEVVYTLAKRFGLAKTITDLKTLAPIVETVAADEDAAQGAASIKHNDKLGYADSFAAELAMRWDATLVTADPDFAKLGKRLKLMALARYSPRT